MNGFLAGVGEHGSTRFLALTLFVTPHLHQRSRAIARRTALRNWPAEANVARHRISVLLRFLTVFLCDFLELL
jgi:hypothetical protein